jgi:uncharacterized membrane protein
MVDAIQNKKEMIMAENLKRLNWLVIAAPAIYLLIIWNNIPDIVPMHYDLEGNIDRYGSKKELIFLVGVITVVNTLIFLLLVNLHLLDTKLKASQNREKMTRIGIIVSMFISAVLFMLIYTSLNGNIKLFAHLILAAVGLLFSFIGNYMYTIKPNYFAGIRLPWTLKNEENWRMTHLLAGKLWFAGGLLIAIISLFTSLQAGIISALVIILVITIIPGIYSYRMYKEQKKFKT